MAEVEAEDQASETLEPATEALEEQGDSSPAKLVVLPLMERLFGGARIKEKTHISMCIILPFPNMSHAKSNKK